MEHEIIKHIHILSKKKSGWNKEICLVKWGNQNPKLDIRDWDSEYEKCGKGVTLTEDEAKELLKALQGIVAKDCLDFESLKGEKN